MDSDAESEVAVFLEIATGKEIWRTPLGKRFVEEFGDGPRATPVVDGDLIYNLTSYYSDWKPMGGLMLPHRVDVEYGTRNMILEFGRVTINTEVDDARFRQPPPEGMEFLASIAGEWNLRIETRQHPRAPWEAGPGSAVITALLGDGVMEERIEYQESGLPARIVRSWSFDQFRKVYRITQADN